MNNSHCSILFLFIIFGYSLAYTETKSELYSDDTSYTFSVRIPTSLNCFDLSKLLFDQKAVRQFSYFVDSIHFSRIDSFSQIVEIRFQKWFYKGFSRYKRALFPAESLTIDLIKFEHNIPAIPQLKKATIRYFFDSNDNGCSVRYQQSITVNRKIRFMYRKMVELHLKNFTKTLENFIRTAGNVGTQ